MTWYGGGAIRTLLHNGYVLGQVRRDHVRPDRWQVYIADADGSLVWLATANSLAKAQALMEGTGEQV